MYLSYVIASYHRQWYCNIVILLYMYLSYINASHHCNTFWDPKRVHSLLIYLHMA